MNPIPTIYVQQKRLKNPRLKINQFLAMINVNKIRHIFWLYAIFWTENCIVRRRYIEYIWCSIFLVKWTLYSLKKIYSVIGFLQPTTKAIILLSILKSHRIQICSKNTDNISAARIRVGFSNLSYYINNRKFYSNSYQVSHYLDKAILVIYILLQIINSTILSLSKPKHNFPHFSLLNPLESFSAER